MNKIIFEACNGELVVVDGKGYPREDFDKWTMADLCKVRDKMILKLQNEFFEQRADIYAAFDPYIKKAEIKKAQEDEKKKLARTIRDMPQDDVVSIFTAYLNEIVGIEKEDKNE